MLRRLFFLATLAGVVAMAYVVAACAVGGTPMLEAYLDNNQDGLTRPVSVDNRPVRFVVEPGTPARVIGQKLRAAGLIADDTLFEAYVRINGLAEKLEAGTFVLSPSMTIVGIVQTLQHAEAASITITIPEGWRLEQIADYFKAATVFTDTVAGADAYRKQAMSGDITGLDPARYPFLQSKPAGTVSRATSFPIHTKFRLMMPCRSMYWAGS